MSNITKAYLPSQYGQLHYRIAMPRQSASMPPLLCLHQTPGNGRDWQALVPDLAVDRVVIAPDTPGYGMSDPPPEPVLIEDFARVMMRFMQDLAAAGVVSAEPFDVMGYHTGCLTAVEMARVSPEQVRKIVLFGLAAFDAPARAERLANLREAFPVPSNDLSHVEKLWAKFGTLSDSRMSAEDKHVSMAECLRLGSRMPWGYISVYRYDFLHAMTQVEQSALIVNPQDDLWEVTRRTSERLRNGRRWDIPGVSHGVLVIEKDRVVREIREFLRA